MFKSPFPYFGGKSKCADVIWQRLGDPPNYIEPFFGSGAVLFNRPNWTSDVGWTETVNDKDGMISNFFRAVQHAPIETAAYADYPVIENDLHARHIWLVGQRESLTAKLEGNPDYYDAKIAGWWVWGMSLWIGSGFCSGDGAWHVDNGELVKRESDSLAIVGQLPELHSERGIRRKSVRLSGSQGIQTSAGVDGQRPHLSTLQGVQVDGGVARQLPHLSDKGTGVAGAGIDGQSPRLTGAQGVSRKRVHLASRKGVYSLAGTGALGLPAWFEALSARLRRVRVCSGDWTRVMGESVTLKHGLTAVVLDPPYSAEAGRDNTLYAQESLDVAHTVREWALTNGDNPLYRIVLCGYDTEHTLPDSWECVTWTPNGGYGNQGEGAGRANKHRETLWFSPHCLKPTRYQQAEMF